MAIQSLIHLSGLALLIGGVLWTFGSIFHPNNFDPNALLDRFWVPVQIALLVFYLLSVLGVVGLYIRQGEQTGALGLIGFVLALIGSALTVATSVVFAYVLPFVAKQHTPPKNLGDFMKPGGLLPWAFPLTGTYLFFFVPGYILIGIATMSAGVLPSWAGLLLIIGMLASNVGVFVPRIFILRRIGGVIFGIGLVWLGYALLFG